MAPIFLLSPYDTLMAQTERPDNTPKIIIKVRAISTDFFLNYF